jgi:outer membrane protein W
MFSNISRICVAAVLFLPLTASAYHSNLVRGRVGYFDVRPSISRGSKGTTPTQRISEGPVAEVSLTKFATSNLAAEVGIGYASMGVKANRTIRRRPAQLIPVNATVQFHLPIQNTATPYVGVGYTYRFPHHTQPHFKLRSAGGLLYQAGLDVFVFDSMGLNLDFKYSNVRHNLSSNGEVFRVRMKTMATTVGVTVPF